MTRTDALLAELELRCASLGRGLREECRRGFRLEKERDDAVRRLRRLGHIELETRLNDQPSG